MDFFKYNPVSSLTAPEGGEILNNIERSMWVERYSDLGEFSFESTLSSGLRETLPLGTMVSHVNTREIMIVENHEIKDTMDEDASIIVTGRSFPSFLENRIVSTDMVRASHVNFAYILYNNFSWEQIVILLNDHIIGTTLASDKIDNFYISHSVTGYGPGEERIMSRGTLWERTHELLAVDDLGIKTIRENLNIFGAPFNDIHIYRGDDKTKDVVFSWQFGDLSTADYLYSLKNYKNAALVTGTWLSTIVDGTSSKYNKRMVLVDAKDIDDQYQSTPVSFDAYSVVAALVTRGNQALRTHNNTHALQADISNTSRYVYRTDYNLGDLITVDGNFGEITTMRVIEYAEIEDEDGVSGHPTLAFPLPLQTP